MTVGELIKKLNKRDRSSTVYYIDKYGKHEITDVKPMLTKGGTVTIIMNGDGGRYDNRTAFYDTAQDVREETMSKYIKLDDAIGIITEHQGIRGDTFKALHNAYAVDIVRCSECGYYEAKEDWCYWRDEAITADDFCSYGERNEP